METAAKIHLIAGADLVAAAPILLLVAFTLVLILVDVIFGEARRAWLPWIAALALGVTFVELRVVGDSLLAPSADDAVTAFYGCLRFDRMTLLVNSVILGCSFFLVVVSPQFLRNRLVPKGEYYAMILLATVGMMALAMSNELLTLFVNIELVSIALYVLAGIERDNLRSTEAALKYFLMGSYSAAFLLLGLTMVYGATGTTMFDEIRHLLASGTVDEAVFLTAGVALMMVGFGFKLTLVPFHMYAPDVYAGAPTPVAGLIATASKAAGFAAFFNFFRLFGLWPALPPAIYWLFAVVALGSIVVGNVGALTQPNIKRLLAYSGVAHAGYTLLPLLGVLHATRSNGDLAAAGLLSDAQSAIAYYILAYSVTTLAAFGVAATLGAAGDGQIDRYAGLGRRSPALALVLAVALISLTGVPLTAGFVGKFYLFSVAIKAGLTPVAIFAILASVASAYYYLRVIVKMYMEESKAARADSSDIELANATALFICSAGIFLFAIFPMIFLMN